MIGKNNGLSVRFEKYAVDNGGGSLLNFVAWNMAFRDVIDIVIKSINFIRSRNLSHRQFQALSSEMNDEHGDLVYYTEVCLISRGHMLKRFFDLRDDINFFMEQKGKPMAVLDDESFQNVLAFLVDVTEHLDQLNAKLQGANHIVSHLNNYVGAFAWKLIMFCTQLEKFDFAHFPSMSILSPALTEAYVSAIIDLR